MMNKYQIKPIPRMFEQVAKQIINYINSNKLEPGTKLPTERELSTLLGVSRSSIREGIRVLELLHFLESKQGGGTFVSRPLPFLIPRNLIEEQLGEIELNNYFEVALMSGTRIVTTFLNSPEPFPEHTYEKSFWENLFDLFLHLGEKISNPYHSSLLLEIYNLLNTNHYFIEKQSPFRWEELYSTLQERDSIKTNILLNQLLNHY